MRKDHALERVDLILQTHEVRDSFITVRQLSVPVNSELNRNMRTPHSGHRYLSMLHIPHIQKDH